MTNRIVVDPVTRIEGHLRIEAEIDEQGAIHAAYSSGTTVRGIEIILEGRDPREAWAFAQRICGVCTLVHGIASVRAVENALHYDIPANANLIRNLMIAAQYAHDHVMHFYHLHALDWVDVVSALKADPAATLDARPVDLELRPIEPRLFRRRAETAEGVRRGRPARHLRRRILGPSGIQAAARGQSDGGGALSRRARLAARSRQAARHLRRQEPASELSRRRRAGAGFGRARRGGRLGGDRGQHRHPDRHPRRHRQDARLRRRGLSSRHARHRGFLQGLVPARRGAGQFHDLRRVSRRRRRRRDQAARCRRASFSAATFPISSRSTSATPRKCRSSSPIPGTTIRAAETSACTPTRARRR